MGLGPASERAAAQRENLCAVSMARAEHPAKGCVANIKEKERPGPTQARAPGGRQILFFLL